MSPQRPMTLVQSKKTHIVLCNCTTIVQRRPYFVFPRDKPQDVYLGSLDKQSFEMRRNQAQGLPESERDDMNSFSVKLQANPARACLGAKRQWWPRATYGQGSDARHKQPLCIRAPVCLNFSHDGLQIVILLLELNASRCD